MRQVLAVISMLLVASAAQAQLGPSAARPIVRPMPSLAPSGVKTFAAEARVVVTRKGRVDSAEVVVSSGDASFDKQWQKILSDWRFVPAVDGAGEPVDSTSVITYTNTGLGDKPELPGGGQAPPRNAATESERIEKLTCKDFLWEYYIVTNAMSRRLALLDPLVRTPLVMFFADPQVPADQQPRLREGYDALVTQVASQCRDNADALFWSAVMKPALQSALAVQ